MSFKVVLLTHWGIIGIAWGVTEGLPIIASIGALCLAFVVAEFYEVLQR